MKKSFLWIIIVGVLAVGYYLVSPLFITRVVSEDSPLETITENESGVVEVDPAKKVTVPESIEEMESDTGIEGGIDSMNEELDPVPDQVDISDDVHSVATLISEGQFSGFDDVHQGSGDAKLIETPNGFVIRFEDNFKVTNGPDLYVGLGKNGVYEKGLEIARLKGNQGSQNYDVPDDINISEYNEIWIWCKAFSVPFARVEMKGV